MNCDQVRDYLDSLLVKDPGLSAPAEVFAHIQTCQACAREYQNAQETFAALQLSCPIHAPNQLKEQIMSQVFDANVLYPSRPARVISSPSRFWFRVLVPAAAVAAIVFFAIRLHHQPDHQPQRPREISASGFIAQAWAAEKSVFTREGIIHILNRIVVKAISDPELAKIRWLPLVTLDGSGNIHFNQLHLSAEPGEEYTIDEDLWYESSTGNYMQILRDQGSLVFANSFDGKALYASERTTDGRLRIGAEFTRDYRAPQNPALFLGIGSAFNGGLNEKNMALFSDQGTATLEDGTPVRVFMRKADAGSAGAPQPAQDSLLLFKIRDNNAVVEIEWLVGGRSWLTIRRELVENVQAPDFPWKLSGLPRFSSRGQRRKPEVAVTKDMVLPDASVKQMVEKSDSPVYLFNKKPAWTGDRNITDILDITNPPDRMFLVVYPAVDGRHVVLLFSSGFNKMFRGAKSDGQMIYESKNGFKVWTGSRGKWLGGILLRSAQGVTRSAPSEDVIGYVLESPQGTYPALGINGRITDDELHALVDSLVPAANQAVK
ncbi:MAG TPA: hypothetical protein VMG30_20425 [Acidobacteriota bacterium]|nr:hypothetical protein [Acidobacteriota bacterium]